MFVAVLFTTPKKWKQSKYPLMDEWKNKSGIFRYKKEENSANCNTMRDFEGIMLSEICHTGKDKCSII